MSTLPAAPGAERRAQKWNSMYFDVGLVKSWIATCERVHGNVCCGLSTPLPPGFRLLDISKMCVFEPQEPLRFVALSYVWYTPLDRKDLQLRVNNCDHLQQPGGIQISELPDVISDCINLCKALGEHYVWVDKLCIVQDDSSSKHGQIRAMDRIYSMATLTVVAAVDTELSTGLPGVSGRPRRSSLYNTLSSNGYPSLRRAIEQSSWNTRGWTFQESLFSSKCLYVTDFQVYFGCRKWYCAEETGVTASADQGLRPDILLGSCSLTSILDYWHLIEVYSTKVLTYESDILNAFAGVMNTFSNTLNSRFLFGVPEAYFSRTLLWNSHSVKKRELVSEIPSWSWAAWNGRIGFTDPDDDFGDLVQPYVYENEENEPRCHHALEDWFAHDGDWTDDAFRRPLSRRGTNFSLSWPHETVEIWKACPQNPWSSEIYAPIAARFQELGRSHPGSVLFNTTVGQVRLDWQYAEFYSELEILDNLGEPIGYTSWICFSDDLGELGARGIHTFVVLCGALLKMRRTPWYLGGLLVEKRNGVYYRLAAGYIQTSLWHLAKPKWETVVLG